MAAVTAPIHLTIDELRLDGVPAAQRFAVAAALEGELGRLLQERGLPPGLAAGRAPVVPPVDPVGLGPKALGTAVALALYEGWA